MLAGIRDILLITTPSACRQWGIQLSYAEQPRPAGLADAFIVGADFIEGNRVAMILGDNIFFGDGLTQLLARAAEREQGATIFAYHVRDPERYGVVTFDEADRPVRIEEKPERPVSNWAITGLYFFDSRVAQYARRIKPSARGELEITDLQMRYLAAGALQVERMGRGFAWLDTGTVGSLIEAAGFVQTLEHRQGMKVGCPEEVAFRQGFIDRSELITLAAPLEKSGYGKYLTELVSVHSQS